ncbi:MAG: bifunctional alpha,alpha-trehalose-phosphate synthase (UDP-forming)/trehalose-phosphatase [Luteitalea sp.]|nr:bifunctional alpha,alpha-trehalose-phosphate synthase (UDP-forming)/trehalose-phosphatase [Luteitalea sp.]
MRRIGEDVRLIPSSGGLATGLRGWHQESEGVWVGWPGEVHRLTAPQRSKLEERFSQERLAPVYLSSDEIQRYYDGFSNGVLWPLFHYLLDRIPLDASNWDAYRQVNEKFADAVVHVSRRDDMIWVHDYQLMLLPALLRDRLPEARIGFFLHTPFPSSEIFRLLPWRQEVLRGVLGADLVGFHTRAYLRHFVNSVVHIDGHEVDVDRVQVDGREVRLGAFPMGVDVEAFTALAEDRRVIEEVAAIRRQAGDNRILLGVDRLDYTKGIPRRLLAFGRLLERNPELADHVRLIQLAVPTREKVESYKAFRREVEELVGRLNGIYGKVNSVPVHYLRRSVTRRQLVALYRAADVMLVTPLRDGMNLVAKEFVASRVDEDGVLVLSEFAGAATELGEAIVVNPYDINGAAAAINYALSMGASERRTRMRALRRRVVSHDVHRWARTFLERLAHAPWQQRLTGTMNMSSDHLAEIVATLRGSSSLTLFLDYDGSLVPIVATPELALPDAELLSMLRQLSERPSTDVHVVSGRARDTLDEWLGEVPLSLWAEHGLWHRPGPSGKWQITVPVHVDSLAQIRAILEQFSAETPGSRLEEKTASVAWHYRLSDPEFGARQARELRLRLEELLAKLPFELIEGKKVIEVRPRGANKALVVRRVLANSVADPAVLAVGDDTTDDEMFAALPDSSITVAVGLRPRHAKWRVSDPRAVRRLLGELAAQGS